MNGSAVQLYFGLIEPVLSFRSCWLMVNYVKLGPEYEVGVTSSGQLSSNALQRRAA